MTTPDAHARRIARRTAEREQAQAISHADRQPRQADARAIIEAERNRREQAEG